MNPDFSEWVAAAPREPRDGGMPSIPIVGDEEEMAGDEDEKLDWPFRARPDPASERDEDSDCCANNVFG